VAEALNNVETLTFGPVPSRRLGRSLGINNIPHKAFSYSCVYCQVGKTNNITANKQSFYKAKAHFGVVRRKVKGLILSNDRRCLS